MIKTERLRIYTASKEAMEKLIKSQTDGEMRKAYSEMLDGCLKHPEQWEWYAAWIIELNDGTFIGDLCFKGITPERRGRDRIRNFRRISRPGLWDGSR